MNIQIVLLGIALLIIAWTLERIFARLRSAERHVKGMRKRLNILERRVVSESKAAALHKTISARRSPAKAPPSTSQSRPKDSVPIHQNPSSTQTSGGETVCSFCGERYEIGRDKCPKCNHINIEKYRMRKNPDKE